VRRGHDLGAMVSRRRDRMLYDAVLQHFGSWRKGLATSGINLANVSRRRPKHLDREVIILWLQQRQAVGKSLKWTAVCLENRDYALAIRRVFGRTGGMQSTRRGCERLGRPGRTYTGEISPRSSIGPCQSALASDSSDGTLHFQSTCEGP